MTIPYSPPDSSFSELRALMKSRNRWFWSFWISGVLMIVPPLIGFGITAATMVGAFNEVGQTGQGDPAGLARDISDGMVATMLGLVVSFLALIAFVVSLVVFLKKNRALRELQTINPPNRVPVTD